MHVFLVFTFLLVQYKYSVQHCLFMKPWNVHVILFMFIAHPISFELVITQTPPNLNFLQFP